VACEPNRQANSPKKNLQLALLAHALDQGATIAQTNLSSLDLSDKAHLLEALPVRTTTHAPDLGDELVAGLDGRGEAGLELLDVGRVAAAQRLQDAVAGGVEGEEAVDDGAAEAHLHAGLRGGVERVVVAVEAVEQGGHGGGLQRVGGGWWGVGGRVVVYVLWA
jgi:hypothetical protein